MLLMEDIEPRSAAKELAELDRIEHLVSEQFLRTKAELSQK